MRPSSDHRGTRIDIGFGLAAMLAMALMARISVVAHQFETLSQGDPRTHVLTRYLIIPRDGSQALQRVGWPEATIRDVAARLGKSASVIPIRDHQTVANAEDRAVSVTIADVAPEAWSQMLVDVAPECDPSVVLADHSIHRKFGERLDIGGVGYALRPANLDRLKILLDSTGAVVVMRCMPAADSDASVLLVRGEGISPARLDALSDDKELFRPDLFGSRMLHAPLSSEIARAIESEWRWLQPLSIATAVIGLLLVASWGVVRGTGERGAMHVRRALGARRRDLLAMMARRTAMTVTAPALFGAVAVWLTQCWLGSDVEDITPWPVLLTGLVMSVVAALAYTTAALRRLDLPGFANGSARSTLPVRPYLAIWTSAFALIVLVLATAVSTGNHLLGLQSRDLGYRPEGLRTYAMAIPLDVSPASRDEIQLGIYDRTAAMLGASRVTLACNAPWQFRKHLGFSEGADDNIGIGIGAGPGFFGVIGTSGIQGRDFTRSDMGTGVSVFQGSDRGAELFTQGTSLIGRTRGILSGVLRPQDRVLVARPIGADESCRHFELVVRATVEEARRVDALVSTLRAHYRSVAIDDGEWMTEYIARERLPITRLFTALAATSMLVIALMMAVIQSLIVAFSSANGRELAIRMALGQRSVAAAGTFTRRVAVWTSFGLLAGVALASSGQLVLESTLLGYQRIGLSGMSGIAVVLAGLALL